MEREAGVSKRLRAIAACAARLALALCLAATPVATGAFAQSAAKPKPPVIGQEGKDAIWVPTPETLIELMLDLAKVTPDDKVVDLGSGDGRAVIAAAKRGARARGVEYDENLVAYSKMKAEEAGVAKLASFERADIFETDFSESTVIVLFLLPDMNIRLRPKILAMKPGTRVVSNTFGMGGWYPDQKSSLESECEFFFCEALLWVVPAQIGGDWTINAGGKAGKLSLKQEFQMLSGTITVDDKTVPLTEGQLLGDHVTFTAGGTVYTGTVRGEMIEGITTPGSEWQARRGA